MNAVINPCVTNKKNKYSMYMYTSSYITVKGFNSKNNSTDIIKREIKRIGHISTDYMSSGGWRDVIH